MTTDDHRVSSSLIDVLKHVVKTLQDAERSDERTGSGTGTVGGKNVRTDYGFSVRTGPGPDPDSLWERFGTDDSASASGSTTTDDDYLVDVREDDGEIVVLADLPQATAESITAGIDREANALVIGLEGKVIERILLGDAEISVADSAFKNGVLEMRLRTDGGER